MKKVLCKSFMLSMLLLVTLFSFSIKSYGATFAYKDFNWEEFSSQNKNYWLSLCGDREDCEDPLLATKKNFYITLYRLLTNVQNKYGVVIDDNIIIATVFYGLDMESFKDPVEGEKNAYNIDTDETTKGSFIGSNDGNADLAKKYFENETDTIKLLINNFIGYRLTCYGVSSETPSTGENGVPVCSDGLIPTGDKCVAKLDDYKGTFFESLGLYYSNDKEKKCNESGLNSGYNNVYISSTKTEEINEDFYWTFLEESNYFDTKDHLQQYYAGVLQLAGKKHMNEIINDDELFKKYESDIITVRKRIIYGIKDVLKNYEGISEKYNSVTTNLYWWPIGSDEINEVDGVSFANGEPSKTNISSNFGLRNGEIHNGIDIPGELGVTNVVASKDGVVVYSSLSANISCEDNADETCGSGYGNYVIIEHIDGYHTLYAHMSKDSITLNVGDSVKQGQVLGKVGNSGRSTGPHLHFEVRVGGNDATSVQNPMNYVSNTNTRPFGGTSEFVEWIGNMEGTGPVQGDSYVVYNDSGGVATVGHGITLKYNKEDFLAHGINPDTLSVGSLVPKVIVDSIYQKDLDARSSNIKSLLARKNVVLNDNQIAALISLQFNCGNINGFFENYESYGSSQALCDNWWHNKALHDAKGNRLSGLEKRRRAECDLFVNGNYNMNVYG